MQINYLLLSLIIAMALYIAVQEHKYKLRRRTLSEYDKYYRTQAKELNRAKKTVIQQERVIKYFCRLVDSVPEIEQAYNDLIGGNEKR